MVPGANRYWPGLAERRKGFSICAHHVACPLAAPNLMYDSPSPPVLPPCLLLPPLYGLCGRAQCSQHLGTSLRDHTCIHIAPGAQVTQDSCSDGFHQQPLRGLQLWQCMCEAWWYLLVSPSGYSLGTWLILKSRLLTICSQLNSSLTLHPHLYPKLPSTGLCLPLSRETPVPTKHCPIFTNFAGSLSLEALLPVAYPTNVFLTPNRPSYSLPFSWVSGTPETTYVIHFHPIPNKIQTSGPSAVSPPQLQTVLSEL